MSVLVTKESSDTLPMTVDDVVVVAALDDADTIIPTTAQRQMEPPKEKSASVSLPKTVDETLGGESFVHTNANANANAESPKTKATRNHAAVRSNDGCLLIYGFLLYAAAAGFYGLIVHGFEPVTTTAMHRPHCTHALLATANHRHHWPLRAKLESNDNDDKHIYKEEGNDSTTTGAAAPFFVFSRRSALLSTTTTTLASCACAASSLVVNTESANAKAGPNGLILQTAPDSGLRWADARVGTGEAPRQGATASIDYSMASTAGRFPSIYSTKNGDEPYRWKLGDGTTIRGIEMAVMGDPNEGIPPMLPGGIRRVIVPNNMGYNSLIGRDEANNVILNKNKNKNTPADSSQAAKNQRCLAGNENSLGPIPPKEAPDGAYQRWYQFYCNPRIPYQPDLVLDIKLYGARTVAVVPPTPPAVEPQP